MNKTINKPIYNLEERTLEFSKRIARMCHFLAKSTTNDVYIRQILRSGTSVGANYIEANEALSKKDFQLRIRISRKEAKETTYWLDLIVEANPELKTRIEPLIQESFEIRKILSAIINKVE